MSHHSYNTRAQGQTSHNAGDPTNVADNVSAADNETARILNDLPFQTTDPSVDNRPGTPIVAIVDDGEAKDVSGNTPTIADTGMEQFAQSLIQAVAKLGSADRHSLSEEVVNTKGPQARPPDKFDGSRADLLRPFLSQLNIVFLNHQKRFTTDRAKVLFAGSYLFGVAADWFEPVIDESSKESMMLENWSVFKDRITQVFGDPNAEATAEHNIEMLHMRDSEAISGYITRFRTESARLHWDDAALKYRFRIGLCDRILDDLARMTDQPRTLSDLIEMALTVDNRYWERIREKKLRPKASYGSSNASPTIPSSGFRRLPVPSKPSGSSPFQKKPTYNRNPSNNTNRPFDNKKSNNLDKVLVNGRLTADEKQRRAERGLCSYCGGPHSLDHCPAKPDKSVSGRRVATPPSASSRGKN